MKKSLSILGFGLSLIFLAACGSSPTNNQGVSFTLLGFFQGDASEGSEARGEVGQYKPLSAGGVETQGGDTAGDALTYVGLQNNITSQFLRVDRLEIEYFIEGSRIQPPNTAIALTSFLGKAPSTGTGSSSSSGSNSSSTIGTSSANISYTQFPIVPSDIMTWLNFNRNSLPELPFTMIATVKASAVSSAGDRYASNEGSYFIIFTPDNVIAPTEGQ
jgi:hypothetical protein